MNRPDFVTEIAGHKWVTRYVKGLMEQRNLFGQCLYPQRVIELDESLQGESHDETLMHEHIHAVAFEYGINVPENKVRILGLGLHQAFKPWLKLPKTKATKGKK